MKCRSAVLTASLLLSSLGSVYAQTILVDWGQTWNYMHPTSGVLPPGSGTTTPHPAGTTPWYAVQATFAASYTGPSFATGSARHEAGAGVGPIGYGTNDYMGTPLPPPAEFSAFGTTLTTPASGQRSTAYFRTTFTVPADGGDYSDPVIRYILDDGGFIYLDGVLVLEVNVAAGAADDYTLAAAGTANTESHIRRAALNLAPGSLTGGNDEVAPPIAGNATVVEQIESLAPGVHTLAVAVHQASGTSSDLALAVQLQAGVPDCTLDATIVNVSRNTGLSPNNPGDDLIDLTLNVVPTGNFGATWEIVEPATSAAAGKGGAYNTDVAIAGIPISEFSNGALSLVIADVDDPLCSARVSIFPPRIIGTNDLTSTSLPIITSGPLPTAGWVFDDVARTISMNNGGGGARQVFSSSVIDLSGVGTVQFTGELRINDTSSGNEDNDSFVAYLIIDGATASPINLITPYDTLVVDGVLTDNELAPMLGNYVYELSYEIPARSSSVQIVIEGINNSGSETFIVAELRLARVDGEEKPFFDVNSSGNDLVFTWASRDGELFNLRSETGLTNLPLDWPIFGGQADLVATPPLNTLTIPRPADPERFFVIEVFPAPPSSLFSDDFESGQGAWTVGSDGGAGTAWELGTPTNVGPAAAHSPVNCFGTNLTSNYGFEAEVWLRSPAIDLTSAGGATVSYFQFFDIEEQFDFATLSVLDAADNSVLAVIGDGIDGVTADWEQASTSVPAAALGKSVKFEFRLTSDIIGNFPGWYIDDFVVTVP